MIDKREKLRLKMVEHQNEAHKLRQQITTIDNLSKTQQIEELVGKTFKDEHSWFRVEKFDYDHNYYIGTVISIFGKGKQKSVQVEFNETIYEDLIREETTKRITSDAFRTKLDECGKMIIKAMDYKK